MNRPLSELNRWKSLEKQVKKLYDQYNLTLFNWDSAPKSISFYHYTIRIDDCIFFDRYAFDWSLVFDCFSGKLLSVAINGFYVDNIQDFILGKLDEGADPARILEIAENMIGHLSALVDNDFTPAETVLLA